jgi:hypothetical protein
MFVSKDYRTTEQIYKNDTDFYVRKAGSGLRSGSGYTILTGSPNTESFAFSGSCVNNEIFKQS